MAEKAVLMVAELMALSARTAPKARGTDSLVIKVVSGDDLKKLAAELRRLGEALKLKSLLRDSGNIDQSSACLLIGSRAENTPGLNCGGCGHTTCSEMLEAQKEKEKASATKKTPFNGPNCVIRMADLGIALGSAAKTASLHNVDTRIMYSAGVGALSLGWMESCKVAYGIPLSASGKSIFFDR